MTIAGPGAAWRNEGRSVNHCVRLLAVSAVLLAGSATLAQPNPGFGQPGAGFPPRGIFGGLPLLGVLDANGDGQLAADEIAAAAAVLARQDRNGDSRLDGAELFPAPGSGGLGAGTPDPTNLFGMLPYLMALDQDRNGVIEGPEIASATESLQTLDGNGNGWLESTEFMPVGQLIVLGGRGGRGGRGGFGPGGFGGPVSTELIAPENLDPADGAATLPSREEFERLSYQGNEVLIDTQLAGIEFVKFVLLDPFAPEPKMYFMETNQYRAHMMFMSRVGIGGGNFRGGDGSIMRGVLSYRPELRAPNGQQGLYTFEFEPFDAFDYELIQAAHDELVRHAPLLADRLAYHVLPAAVGRYEQQRARYAAANLPVLRDEELYADVAWLPLNLAEGYGFLRLMELDERPDLRDVVLYRSLPNELPRVAGIITTVPQTPLSHVNLRAAQDQVPNAFIRDADTDPAIAALVGKYVHFRVAADGYAIREATSAEVEAHFATLRPAAARTPPRDLAAREIRPLAALDFAAAASVGVKAANLAELRKLGLPDGVVPDGYAIPFYFYDTFMQANGFYDRVRALRAEPEFAADANRREQALAELREAIREAAMPEALLEEIAGMQRGFPDGTSIRLRSSTNNEDLPGFSGAGLYDSYTHRPDEGHLAETVKQVFASLWNFRAYEEREFYRIDHFATAMGVLAHPNFSDEAANGVAVSDDIVYGNADPGPERQFYVNVQLGEDLVTNPDALSVPEQLLLDATGGQNDRLIATSNLTDGEPILSIGHRNELRDYLARIHAHFAQLYRVTANEPFAIEIEFKVTAAGRLSIKQARPWVY